MAETNTLTRTTDQILGNSPARELLQDIFADLHPGLTNEKREIASIFSAQSARDFLGQLTNFEELISAARAN